MIDKTKMIQIENFSVPNGGDYNGTTALQMHRRGNYKIADGKVSIQSDYTIGGMQFQVNSIFDLAARKTAVDDVRHLIDAEIARTANIS